MASPYVLSREELLPPLPEGMQELWPHQREPVATIARWFREGATMVTLDAPPGAGKSLIAEMVRRELRVQALYLCQTKILQIQLEQSFPYARTIMGRDNYLTLDDPSKTARDCDAWRKRCKAKRGCNPNDHCSWCFPTGTLVVTKAGVVPIESINEGDEVMSALTGQFEPVVKTMARRQMGSLWEIKTKGSPAWRVTAEHPIWASRHQEEAPTWINASDLEPDDYVWATIARSRQRWSLSRSLLRLLGWYLAEGHISGDRSISFSLHSKETDYHAEIVALAEDLGVSAKIVQVKENTTQILIHDAVLAHKLRRMGGSGAAMKSIAPWVLYESGDVIEILRAAWLGDGETLTPTCTHSHYDTTSLALAHQFQLLLLRVGIVPAMIVRPARHGHAESYRLSVSGFELPKLGSLMETRVREPKIPKRAPGVIVGDRVGYRVQTIAKVSGGTTVHNLEVEGSNTYLLPGHVGVHNCHPQSFCPYDIAKSEAMAAPLAIANTAYAFLEWGARGKFKDWDLVILDEWDTVEGVLFNTLNVELTPRELARFELVLPGGPADAAWMKAAAEGVFAYYEKVRDDPPDDWPRIAEKVIGLRRAAAGLVDKSWLILDQNPERGIQVGPIEVGELGKKYLWPHGRRWLLMSGTAIDMRLRLKKLGWTDFGTKQKPGKGRFKRLGSVYPVANRPVRVWPVAPMTRANREQSVPKIAKAIGQILDNHRGERVLVHTGTYEITTGLQELLAPSYGNRLVTFSRSKERDFALERFLKKDGAVLMGPAMERGLDLPDDACRVIVICRVAYPYQGDPRVKARSKEGGPWWVLQAVETIATLVQMTGRGMRHANDHVISYILDSQFKKIRYHGNYEKRWPAWWKESLVEFSGFPEGPKVEEL